MSVTIRLSKIGKTGAPAFKIVAANTKDKLDGRAIEVLGHYNPSHTPPLVKIDRERFADWKKKGAIISPAVAGIVEDKYEFKPYTRQNEMKDDDNTQAVAQEAVVAEEKTQAAEEVIAEKVQAVEEAQVAEAQAAEEAPTQE